MNPTDRQRLKQAFDNAIANTPDADKLVEGVTNKAGLPMSFRELMLTTANSEEFYQEVEKAVSNGTATVDKLVAQISATRDVVPSAPKGSRR